MLMAVLSMMVKTKIDAGDYDTNDDDVAVAASSTSTAADGDNNGEVDDDDDNNDDDNDDDEVDYGDCYASAADKMIIQTNVWCVQTESV